MPSLHRVRQILPLRSCEVVRGEAQPQVLVHVRALVLLGLHGVKELLELRHVGLRHLRLHPAVRQIREARVADHVARVARDHEAAGVPLVRGQGQLRGEALRLHQRLVVDHHKFALVRPAVSLQEDPRALVAQQPQLRAAVGGPAEAAPVMVSVAPVSAPVAAKLAAVAAPEAVSVPVDTSPTVVKFPALAVLLMVSVLPVLPVAELSRPTLAAPVMPSELPDTAPVDVSVAPATVPVAVSAAEETAPKASTPVVNTSVQFTSLRSWSQPTLPCAVSPSSVAEPVRASESASRSVTEPGDRPAEGFEVQLRDFGRADVHHQLRGRAQPVPATEGVASPRRQRVGAHDVPGEGAQGHGVALQLEASHSEAGQGHGALAVGAHKKIS